MLEPQRDLYKMAESVHDKTSFIEFVMALKEDRDNENERERVNPSSPYSSSANGWENGSIEAFLDSMAAWVGATSAITKQPMVPDEPSWRIFAMILHAGKFYE